MNSTEDFPSHTTSHLHYVWNDSTQVTVTGAEGLPGRYSTLLVVELVAKYSFMARILLELMASISD